MQSIEESRLALGLLVEDSDLLRNRITENLAWSGWEVKRLLRTVCSSSAHGMTSLVYPPDDHDRRHHGGIQALQYDRLIVVDRQRTAVGRHGKSVVWR